MKIDDINYEHLLDEIIKDYNPLSKTQIINEGVRRYLKRNLFFGRSELAESDSIIFGRLNQYIDNKYNYGKSVDATFHYYTPNNSWKTAANKGGHIQYQNFLKEKDDQAMQDEVDVRHLRKAELEKAILDIFDYKKVNTRSRNANIISIAAIVVTIIGLILQYNGCSKH